MLIHSDGVVQGLNEAPFVRDVGSWVGFTIATGLGNAPFRDR